MQVSDIIDRTLNEWIYPSGTDRPSFDTLLADISDSVMALSLTGRLAKVPRDSVLEVEHELMLVDTVTGSDVALAQRGYGKTDLSEHLAGVKVYLNPKFSRIAIFDALKIQIQTLYPMGIYWKGVDTTTKFDYRGVLQLPTQTPPGRRILSIVVERLSGDYVRYRELIPGRDFKTYEMFSPTKYQLYRGGAQDAPMVVTYARDFGIPISEGDDLDDMGVPSSIQNQLPFAVAGYLLQTREIPKVVVDEIRRMLAQQQIQVGSALNVGQAMLKQFEKYVMAERQRMRDEDQTRFEWTR